MGATGQSASWRHLPPVTVEFPVTALACSSGGLWAGGAGGVAWLPEDSIWQARVSGLALTAIGALAYAGGWLFAGGAEGIARSRDGGQSWHLADAPGARGPVAAFAVSPHFAEDTTILAATIGNGVRRSDDAGKTWEPASFGLHDREVTALAWGPGELLVAGTANGIYRSANGGRAWRAAAGSDSLAIACLAFLADGVAVAVTEEGVLLRGADGGVRWTSHGELPEGIVATAILPLRNDVLLLATASHGMLLSLDGGTVWAEVADGEMLALARCSETLYAGTTAGLLRSQDGGATWAMVPSPPVHDLRRLVVVGDSVLLAGRFSGVVRYDPTRGWTQEPAPAPLTALEVTPNGMLWAAGAAGLEHSTDGGQSWILALEANDQRESESSEGYFSHLTFGSGGSGWAGSADGSRLLHTRDGGSSWDMCEAPFGVLPLAALQVAQGRDERHPVLMAATYDPRLQMAQLWRTLDDGLSWERGVQVRTEWPIVATCHAPPLLALGTVLLVERTDGTWVQTGIRQDCHVRRVSGDDRVLLSLTTAGIFRSADGGQTWTGEDTGLPIDQIMDIAVAGGAVYVLLAGGMVWSRPLAGATS